MDRTKLEPCVMTVPDILVDSVSIVSNEPCEDCNKVHIYNNMHAETATERRSMVEMLVSRLELFDRLKHVRIHPDFIPWRPGCIENDQIW